MSLRSAPGERRLLGLWWCCTAFVAGTACEIATGATVTYELDVHRSRPSVEVVQKGVTRWKGQLQFTRGTMTIDREAQRTGVSLELDMSSVDFGGEIVNNFVKGPLMFDVQRYPTARFDGQLSDAVDGMPTKVDGILTLHGITKPLKLKLNQMRCHTEEGSRRERCAATASGQFLRDEFGVDFGGAFGLEMAVALKIHAEAVASLP